MKIQTAIELLQRRLFELQIVESNMPVRLEMEATKMAIKRLAADQIKVEIPKQKQAQRAVTQHQIEHGVIA